VLFENERLAASYTWWGREAWMQKQKDRWMAAEDEKKGRRLCMAEAET